MPHNFWYDVRTERSLIELADICYALSAPLADRFANIRSDIKILPNAVDDEQFKKKPLKKPTDLKSGEVTVGFWGSFWQEWFDWSLIKDAAAKRLSWYFNLIGGDPQSIRSIKKGLPGNVVMLGQKKWNELYKYLYYFDVCIIPYKRIRGSVEANPVKALEYLGGFKPVVSYYNESLKGIPYIYFYKKDFIKKIEIAQNTPIDKEIIDNFLKENTWEKRLETMLGDLMNLGKQ